MKFVFEAQRNIKYMIYLSSNKLETIFISCKDVYVFQLLLQIVKLLHHLPLHPLVVLNLPRLPHLVTLMLHHPLLPPDLLLHVACHPLHLHLAQLCHLLLHHPTLLIHPLLPVVTVHHHPLLLLQQPLPIHLLLHLEELLHLPRLQERHLRLPVEVIDQICWIRYKEGVNPCVMWIMKNKLLLLRTTAEHCCHRSELAERWRR